MWAPSLSASVFLLFTASSVNAVASIPLAVRTPFLSTWVAGGEGDKLNNRWPEFWSGSDMGWAGFIRVDGQAYNWMGMTQYDNLKQAEQKSVEWSSSSTVFAFTAGPVDFTVTFLSPVTPTDYLRLSLPFSYLSVVATPNDDQPHDVQIYTDIAGQWASSDENAPMEWSTSTGKVVSHEMRLKNQDKWQTNIEMIKYGAAYYSALNSTGLSYQTGEDSVVRKSWVSSGKLPNTQDDQFRSFSDRWPVFAFSQNLGKISAASKPVVFSVGHVRDPSFQYKLANDVIQERSSYFFAELETVDKAIEFFLDDFSAATDAAAIFDKKVRDDAAKHGENYAFIVEKSMRQTFGSCELTVGKNADGTWNKEDILYFQKELSSGGFVNTVDVVYPAWPALIYTNAELGKFMLETFFAYMATGQWPHKWSMHDLGGYPNALGHNDGIEWSMPLEETGNMLIMTLSYLRATGDKSQAEKYYDLLDQWSQYLIGEALIPAEQRSSDDFQGPLVNQTNLAIKGILGLKSMSVISNLLGKADKAEEYKKISDDYLQQWIGLGMASNGEHLTLNYGAGDSWGTAYNLYADKLLGLNWVPQDIYDKQNAWYKSHLSEWGLQLDTRNTIGKTDWEIWTAALVDDELKNKLIDGVAKFAREGKVKLPFSDKVDVASGKEIDFRARAVVGGHLALLALDIEPGKAPMPTPAQPTQPENPPVTPKPCKAKPVKRTGTKTKRSSSAKSRRLTRGY